MRARLERDPRAGRRRGRQPRSRRPRGARARRCSTRRCRRRCRTRSSPPTGSASGTRGAERRDRGCRGRGSLLGDGRGHGVGVVRRHERNLPEHARRGRCRRGGQTLLGLAVRSSHDLLPRPARLQPGRHGHRGRGAAPDPLDPRRRDVHRRPRQRRARQAGHRGLVRPGRGRRVGQRLAGPLRRAQERSRDHHALGPPQGARDRTGRGRRHASRAS